MTPLWNVLITSALVLALVGWLPRSVRPAPAIMATVSLTVVGVIAVSVLGVQLPLLLVLLGGALGLTFAVWHRLPRVGHTLLDHIGHWTLALSLTAATVALVYAGAAAPLGVPGLSSPEPPGLAPDIM